MPPQRYFSRKEIYQQSNVHDDFIEKLPQSANEKVKRRELVPKNPRL